MEGQTNVYRQAVAGIVSGMGAYRLDGGRGLRRKQDIAKPLASRGNISKLELTRKLWAAKELGIAARANIVKISHWEYWRHFCKIWNVDVGAFAALGANTEQEMSMRLKTELDVLSAFAAFIVFAPRLVERRRSTNSVNYAEQVISSVRGHYERVHGRRTGLTDGPLGGKKLHYTLRGLRKLAPSPIRIKLPILQRDLRMMRKALDLEGSHLDRTLWELWLCQLQGVMRCGDLIKRIGEGRKGWDPARDTNRGRLRIEMIKDEEVRDRSVKLVLAQKPSKTDPARERRYEKGFVIDREENSLSAGEALWKMLRKDPEEGRKEVTPLFRESMTNVELTYEESSAHLSRVLKKAGIDKTGLSTHSLRIGGATAYANSPEGLELVAGCMSLWRSKAGDGYIHAGVARLERAGMSIGREDEDRREVRPGPVRMFAGSRR